MNDADDPVEALLSKPQPYIEDDGFTARVISALPPPRVSPLRGRVLGAFAGAAGLAVVLGPARAAGLAVLHGSAVISILVMLAASLAVLAFTAVAVALREAEQ